MSSFTPVPIGPGVSFSNVQPSVNTAFFDMTPGYCVATFQPVDRNNPGTATLYDRAGNAVLTFDREGYENYYVAVPTTYYFSATSGANLLALTYPTIGFR